MSEPPGHGRGRRALALGVALAVVYLAGAALSGRASPLARRPLLDGLAPPTPYRGVHPPAELAAGNKPPAGGRFLLELTAQGSQLSAFSTSDGQVNLILSQGAVPFRAGQIEVVVTVEPLDPARLAAPAGMLVAGNAYRLQAAYRSSGRKVSALAASPASSWSIRCWRPRSLTRPATSSSPPSTAAAGHSCPAPTRRAATR